MFYLGLLLPVIYIAGYTGASVPTQWAFLSLALPLSLRRSQPIHVGIRALGFAFCTYALLSLWWSPSRWDSGYGLWLLAIWCLSFKLGYATEHDHALWRGLSLGLALNIPFALANHLGYFPIRTYFHDPAGLLYNPTVLSAVAALTALALCERKLWWYLPSPIVALALAHSRGGWVVLAFAGLWRLHWIVALLALSVLALLLGSSVSDTDRLTILGYALRSLTPFGWSPGSFNAAFYLTGDHAYHPEFVHNDYVQLLFEYGLAAAVPLGLFLLALLWTRTLILPGALALACFWFPLYEPIGAFIICYAMGHSLRSFSLDRLVLRSCRPDLLPRSLNEQFGFS